MISLLAAAAGVAFMPALSAMQVTETADFSSAEIPFGWTVANGEYRSPEYSNSVSRIELSYSANEAETPGRAQLFAVDYGTGEETLIAAVNTATVCAVFGFSESVDYRAFRLVVSNLTLERFSATWTDMRLDTPTNVSATALTTSSLEVSWDAVPGADSYKVSIWTNLLIGASAGRVVWEDGLPGATNAYATSIMSDQKFAKCFANDGWSRSDKAGYPTGEDGTLRIGVKDAAGWIQTPQIAVSDVGLFVRFAAKAIAQNTHSMKMKVERISEEGVNIVGEVELSTEMKEFFVAVPDWGDGDMLRFNSLASGDRRVVIGSVAMVAGYSSGTPVPDVVSEVSIVDSTSCTVEELPQSIPVLVGVTAEGMNVAASLMSAGVAVDLSNPPPCAMMDACPISSLKDRTYTQSFDTLSAITSSSGYKDWINGTTLRYWQAYKKNTAVNSFKWNGGTGATGGLYALSTNQSNSVRALGGYSTKSEEMLWGVAFTNDTDAVLTLSTVSYSAQQWGFNNTVAQTLSVSAIATNTLDWISAYGDGWLELGRTQSAVYEKECAHPMPASTLVVICPSSAISVAPGEIMMLKWTLHSLSSGTSGMMGIDDLTVVFQSSSGFSIQLVTNRRNN